MRILVTGGAGYIGGFTARRLAALGHQVVVYDNLSAGHRQGVVGAELVAADLADTARLDHVFVTNRIEAVIHFAASCYVGESVTHPAKYYLNNLLNGANLLDAVRRHGVQRFVFSSTCATYGDPVKLPLAEDHPQRPVNPYGNTKLAFEYMLRDYAGAYGLGFAALRYFNAAGAAADGTQGEHHDPETHLIPLVLQVALGQRPHVSVFGTDYPTPDGTCVRDYVHVEDLAEAHVLALDKITPGCKLAYNVGTGTGNSVREVIRTCEQVTGKPIAVQEAPRRPGDPPVLVAAGDKIRTELGWAPKYPDLKAIVETAWRWHKGHPKGYDK
ncbi:MAG: UDP-glucose 4-epimerase GalE [Gemmataceae bacterium]